MQRNLYRNHDLKLKLDKMGIFPLDIMIVGATGAGKSTTVNSLLGIEKAKIGCGVTPETIEIIPYEVNMLLRVWDTPGLGDGVQIDKNHKEKMVGLLKDVRKIHGREPEEYCSLIDFVMVIVEGTKRDLGSTYSLLEDVVIPNINPERVFVVINQADKAMKGRHWNEEVNEPEKILLDFLEKQSLSIQERIRKTTGIKILKPLFYSAESGYNVSKLLDFIIDNVPTTYRVR